MGMHDKLLELAIDDDIGGLGATTTGVTSGQSIALSPPLSLLREIGQGTGLCVDVNVTEDFAGSGVLLIYAVISPALPPTFGAPVANQVYLGVNGPFTQDKLVYDAGSGVGLSKGTTMQIALSPYAPDTGLLGVSGYPYLNLVYVVTTAAFTAGKISARLTLAGRSQAVHYDASTGGLT